MALAARSCASGCATASCLRNDEPYCHTGNGDDDSQLFNIAVQGVCALNNGYQDFKGDGVESAHRSLGATKDGYNDGGEPFVHNTFQAFGGEPFHHHYPLQMFDRKLRPMDTCFVGLVCTKRMLTDAYRERLIRQSPRLQKKYADSVEATENPIRREAFDRAMPNYEAREAAARADGADQALIAAFELDVRTANRAAEVAAQAAKAQTERTASTAAIGGNVQSFYTFHYVCFSSNQAWKPRNSALYNSRTGLFEGVEEAQVAQYGYADPAAKKATKHYEEAKQGETYDPYIGPSRREFEGMVGAWKVGQVLDISAKKRDQYTGGPVDTTTAVTINVNVEFKDWRALRRAFDRPDIGIRAPGARAWTQIALSDVFSERLGERAPGALARIAAGRPDALAAFQAAASALGLDGADARRSRRLTALATPIPRERPGASQAEIDKHNAWIAVPVKVHARPRALFRLQPPSPAPPLMDEVNPRDPPDLLPGRDRGRAGAGARRRATTSASSSGRRCTMPLLDGRARRTSAPRWRPDNDDRMRETRWSPTHGVPMLTEPRTASPFDDLFRQRDNVRYKLLTNLPHRPAHARTRCRT